MNKRPKFQQFMVLVLLVILVLSACKPNADYDAETQAVRPEPKSTSADFLPVEVIETEQNTNEANLPGFVRQGAASGFMDTYQAEEVATGGYDPTVFECGAPWLANFSEDFGDNTIRLHYSTPVIPTQIELFTNSKPETIKRVELLNSFSGLAVIYDESQPPQWKQSTIQGPCENSLKLEIETEIEVDTIFIEFTDLASASRLDAVELSGQLNLYTSPLIYWRVPLPDTPVDMVVNPLGKIFVAAGTNGLYKFDLEGNQLDKMHAPDQADVMSVEADASGNFFVADSGFGWLVVFDSEGFQSDAGGEDIFGHLAYNPADDNLYLLRGDTIEIYSTDAVALIRQIQLDDLHSYANIAFDSGGRMFLLRDHDWDAVLLEMDPLTGEELDAFPLITSNHRDIVAKDLTVDAQGNFYVLFSMNTGEIAVHMLDPRGNLMQRFGHLTSDIEGWSEGSFWDPKAISVTPDGRFLMIVDGYEDESYLSAFLLVIDE